MGRQIIRATLQATAPGTKTYAAWNPADKNANITLTESNMRAASVVATGQSVRATQAFVAGKSYYCELTWNSGAEIYFGVGNASASLSQYPGQNTNSWSCRGSNGLIYQNGGSAGSGPACSVGGTIGLMLRWDPATDTWSLHFRTTSTVLNMSVLNNTYFTGLTGTLYLMTGSTTAFNGTLRTGAAPFVYQVPDGPLAGQWTESAESANNLYIANEGFVANSNDDLYPDTLFTGRILPTSQLIIDRSVSVWPWAANSSARSGFGQLILANHDGALDTWRDLNIRGKNISLEFADASDIYGDNLVNYTAWVSCVVESITHNKDGTVTVILGDRNLLLDKPLTSKTFPSWVAEAARERPNLVCLGTTYHDPVMSVGSPDYIFDAHDDVIWAVDEVRDRGDLDTLTTDYTARNNGFKKVHVPVGKISGKFRGAVKRGTQLFTDAFTSWSAGAFDNNPTGWTVSGESSANERVYERTTGRCALKKSGGGTQLSMERNVGFVSGTTYVVSVPCTYFGSGDVRFFTSNGAGVYSAELFKVDSTRRVGSHAFLVTPSVGQTHLHIRINAGATAEAEFESVTINVATHVSRLPDWMNELIVSRAGLTTSEYSTSSVTTVDTEAPYALGYMASNAPSIRSVLQETMDSYCGWLVRDRDGLLTAGRLREPSSTSVLTINRQDTLDDLICEPDRAPNLSVTIGAMRNWNKHGPDDFATTVSATDRARLSAEFQIVRSRTGIVDRFYAHADNAAPKGTLITTAADADAEALRLAGLYSRRRYFYTVTVLLDLVSALSLKPGDTVSLVMPDFDLDNGKNLLVIGIAQSFFSRKVVLRLWG